MTLHRLMGSAGPAPAVGVVDGLSLHYGLLGTGEGSLPVDLTLEIPAPR